MAKHALGKASLFRESSQQPCEVTIFMDEDVKSQKGNSTSEGQS